MESAGGALFGDAAVASSREAGLSDAWVQTEVADQAPGRAEAADITDRGHEGCGGGEVHAWHRQQTTDVVGGEGFFGDHLVQAAELFAQEVELAQAGEDGFLLVGGKCDVGEPAPPLHAEEVRGWWAFGQIGVPHGMDLVLQAGTFPHQLGSTGQPTPSQPGGFVAGPDAWEDPAERSWARVRASNGSVLVRGKPMLLMAALLAMTTLAT